MPISGIVDAISAIGALGTASFALVDTSKIASEGGVSNSGFKFIEGAVKWMLPDAVRAKDAGANGTVQELLDVLHGVWINGTPLADQKAIAKSMIKLRLTDQTASQFAKATGVNEEVLAEVAACMMNGTSLTQAQSNVLGRFDLALTALLDAGYQRADQRYRNTARVWAMVASVTLAFFGGWAISNSDFGPYILSNDIWKNLLCGLLATPLAPVSKDLASALAAAAKTAQSISSRT